jgi:V/A-type H+-transporting ATPase subunit K
MDVLGDIGYAASLAFAAIGSAIGAGTAGMSAIGAWKKCYAENRNAPFLLIAYVGAPFTQTLYGYILMGAILDAGPAITPFMKLAAGLFGGIAMGFSAWFQGKAGASASDALGETGKGFLNYIIVLGIVESVALFVMVFLMGVMSG